jgi:hypothetical protein
MSPVWIIQPGSLFAVRRIERYEDFYEATNRSRSCWANEAWQVMYGVTATAVAKRVKDGL